MIRDFASPLLAIKFEADFSVLTVEGKKKANRNSRQEESFMRGRWHYSEELFLLACI